MVLLVGLAVFLTLVVLVGAVAMGLVAVVGFLGASGNFLGFGGVVTGVSADGGAAVTAEAASDESGEGSALASRVEGSGSGAAARGAGAASGVTALTLASVSCE